jgi:hypothetical protein
LLFHRGQGSLLTRSRGGRGRASSRSTDLADAMWPRWRASKKCWKRRVCKGACHRRCAPYRTRWPHGNGPGEIGTGQCSREAAAPARVEKRPRDEERARNAPAFRQRGKERLIHHVRYLGKRSGRLECRTCLKTRNPGRLGWLRQPFLNRLPKLEKSVLPQRRRHHFQGSKYQSRSSTVLTCLTAGRARIAIAALLGAVYSISRSYRITRDPI